jgi:hypothetical protein
VTLTGKAKFGILERKEVPLAMAKFFQMEFPFRDIIVKLCVAAGIQLTIERSLLDYSSLKYRKDLCLQRQVEGHLLLVV